MRKFIDDPDEKVLAIQLLEDTNIGLLVCTLGRFATYQMVINGWSNGNKEISIKTSNTGSDAADFTKVPLHDFILCDFINKELKVVACSDFMKNHNYKFKNV